MQILSARDTVRHYKGHPSFCRCPRARQHSSFSLLQQRRRDQLPAHTLGTVRSPEADHGAASGRREGRHWQPRPHCPGNASSTNTSTSCLKFSAEFARKRAVRSSITIFRNEKQLLKMPTLRAPLLVFFLTEQQGKLTRSQVSSQM